MNPKPTFTLIAFHFFLGDFVESHPGFAPLLARLEAESVRIDQGVYILRTQEDYQLLAACEEHLRSTDKTFGLVPFDPLDEASVRHGYMCNEAKQRYEQWTETLRREGRANVRNA